MSVCTQDIRRALTYIVFLVTMSSRGLVARHQCLYLFLSSTDCENSAYGLGWLYHQSWRRSKANATLTDVVYAVLHVAYNGLYLTSCVGARLGHGISYLAPLDDFGQTVLIPWRQGRVRTMWHSDVLDRRESIFGNLLQSISTLASSSS